MRKVLKEIFQVMVKKGVRVPFKDSDDYYHFFMEKQLPPTAGHHSSMLQDISRGRQTEIDALNGAISQYAKEMGIETPYNDFLTALIRFKQIRGRSNS
jgi:2-dehydropantoate 2-reductase